MKDKKIRLAGILPESLVNGEGLRRVYFCQGCKHNCKGCFSPHTHSFTDGILMDMNELIKDVENNPMIKGITFSGGDCLEQAEKVVYMAKEFKKMGLNIWCYTGYTYEEVIGNYENKKGWYELLENIDVLVEGKFVEELKDSNLKFRGSSNQRIIDVRQSILQRKVVLWRGGKY